ncbi:hypothetical protein ACCAA_470003 [Candidatus Accumulibacter aalborgensis]|uniref:Uncharacterized protein n=1 Tax=Candidatus Accumulibacter aalborgensis TaxID=1860102 RepID=A0A1A8XSX4_9PROT|nr:hypothetical protein ACCAA_470003 [Candidatus Accumulibacter aalborgensis]
MVNVLMRNATLPNTQIYDNLYLRSS